MTLVCPHCGTIIDPADIEKSNWLEDLIEGLVETRGTRFKWRDSWTVKLMSEDFDPDVAQGVVDALVSYPTTYKDYARVFRTWYKKEEAKQNREERTNGRYPVRTNGYRY